MAHEAELKALTGYLEKNHLKQTKQRELILHSFLAANRHLTSEDLYQTVREEYPNIGYTTVYRTMKLLVEAGLAAERHFDDGITRYEVEQGHHDHLVCIECGKIQEFGSSEIEEIQNEIARRHSFRIKRHRHELYGHCSSCQDEAP
ncbi:MAG: transcriptional repressor [bacterium]|nr:transcriptional repressor [Deltaproteobacteria bacterium]MCP4904575.1 transcriptional repressor [bacterium]